MSNSTLENPVKKGGWRRLFQGRFLFISILFHVLLILVATYLVVQTFAPRKKNFTAPPAAPQNKAVEHQVQMAQKKKTMSAPAPTKRVTTTGLAKIVLPEMPELPTTEPTKLTAVASPGMGTATGAGLGGGAGKGGGGGIPFFGAKASSGLKGTFYDLKQDRSGKPNDMKLLPEEQGKEFFWNAAPNQAYDAALTRFVRGGMSDSFLNRYFRAPDALYIKQIYIPDISADEAPKAFNLADKVKGRRWVVVYRGRVIPPQDGRYRFVGFADDTLIVRFNGRLVLDGGLVGATGDNKAREKDFYQQEGMPGVFHTYWGDTVTVKAGTSYSIDIMIGERPGGSFAASLLLEKIGEQYEKDSKGAPKLPIFKLAPSEMPRHGGAVPVVAEDTSWSVWKSQPPKESGSPF